MGKSACTAFIAMSAALMVNATGVRAQQASPAIPPEQRQAFEQLIREYILSNPQIIMEAHQVFQARQDMERADRAAKALSENRDALEKDASSPVAGNVKGDVTVVEFFDYACGYCKRAAPALEAVKSGDANVRVVYKEFPILAPGSVDAARAALAAQRQGKYEAFHRTMMQSDRIDDAGVRAAAQAVGLDVARLEKDMEAPEIMQALQRNQELAAALNIGGTPAFVIGKRLVPGAASAEQLLGMVAEERERLKQAKAQDADAKKN